MKKRPKYLDLRRIRLPLPGIVSILHRMSGFALFLSIPLLLFALQDSLASEAGFRAIRAALSGWPARIVVLALAWAFFHHFCAGLRFLLLDIDRGTSLPAARASSRAVLAASLALTAISGVLLW